jgi:hypothetical protein
MAIPGVRRHKAGRPTARYRDPSTTQPRALRGGPKCVREPGVDSGILYPGTSRTLAVHPGLVCTPGASRTLAVHPVLVRTSDPGAPIPGSRVYRGPGYWRVPGAPGSRVCKDVGYASALLKGVAVL